MANASTPTLLSLDHYAEILGIHPAHFNQVISTHIELPSDCDDVWFQYAWQSSDKASREDLARAIAQAEGIIAEYLKFWPAPTWILQERQKYPKQRMMTNSIGISYFPSLSIGRKKTLELDWKYFIDGGRRKVDEVELGADIVYTDDDGDGFPEVATATVTFSSSYDELELSVFATTDTSLENEIKNLKYYRSGNTVEIIGHASQFVDPVLWNVSEAIDGDDPNSFLTEVNVYRVYTSGEGVNYTPAILLWQDPGSIPFPSEYAQLQLWNPKSSTVTPYPSTWDSVNNRWNISCQDIFNEPDLALIWYYCGYSTDKWRRMKEPFARAVAALATVLLGKSLCGCSNTTQLADNWNSLPVEDRFFWGSANQVDCPFGPKIGAWEAFIACKPHAVVEGISL